MQNYWALRKNTLKILRGVNEPKIEKILGDPTAEKIQILKKVPKFYFYYILKILIPKCLQNHWRLRKKLKIF